MFAFMGPPQIGAGTGPAREVPVRPVDMCPTCGQPRDDHEVVRTPTLTYTVCPGAPAGAGPGA